MLLREKTVIVVTVIVASLMLVLYSSAQAIVANNVAQLEQDQTNNSLERVLKILSNDLSNLDTIVQDWACWDDTYDYAKDANPAYVRSNLVDETFANLRLNLLVITNSSGSTLFAKAFDLQSETEVPIPQDLVDHLSPSEPILSHMSLESKLVGVILLEEGPVLIASRPILTSSKEGPIAGTFIMGRYLDSSEVGQLAERAGEPVVLRRLDDSEMPPDFAVARSSLSAQLPTLVRPLSGEIVAGYVLIDDIYGNPVLILRVDIARDFYRQGQVIMLYLVLSVLAVGVALGAGTLLSLEKLVLTPLSGLSVDVNDIATKRDIMARVSSKGKDELSALAGAINRMLQSLEESQRTLRASEAEYRALFENVPHGIYRSTPGGALLAANPALVSMLGYASEAEILAVDVARDVYVNPQDRQAWVQKIKREGELHDVELVLRRKDGQEVTVLDNAHAMRDNQGAVLYYEGTLTDITERKRMEEEIRKLSQLRESIIDSANVWLDVLDENANVVIWNKAAEVISGYSRQEVVGHGKIWEWLYPDEEYRKQLTDMVADVIQRGRVEEDFETRIRRKDGQIRIISWNERSLLDGHGKTIGSIAIGRDVTERKRMQDQLERYSRHLEELVEQRAQQLVESEKKYRSLVENIPDVVWTTDSEGRTTFVSPNVVKVTGRAPEDIYAAGGTLWLERIHPDDIERVKEAYEALFARNEPYNVQYRFQRKDGEWIWIHDRSVATYQKEGRRYADGLLSDITERKRMEEAILKSERLAAIGETVMMVGHDLRNPLQVIVNSVYLGQEIYDSMPPECKKLFEQKGLGNLFAAVEKQVEYMNKIVSDLQDYARPVIPELVETSLGQLLADTLSTIRTPENIKVSIDADEHLPNAMVDPGLMRRVFANLITNAVQAMTNGGELSIVMTALNGSASVGIQDTGVGIPKENLPKLFHPLFTTKSKGQGLGLAVCKRLIEGHGGTISVESKVGVGTKFTVTVPIQKDVS